MIKLLPVSVVAILLITKFTKPTNGQRIITGDNVKFIDCSKYTSLMSLI